MPRTIGGVVYRHVTSRLVIDSAGNPVEGLTGGVVYANDGTPLAVAEYPSGAAMTTVPTSLLGVTPELWVAFPEDAEPEGYIDWPDDNIPPQAISATAPEIADHQRPGVVAEAVAAALATVTSRTIDVWDGSWSPLDTLRPMERDSSNDAAATVPPGKAGDRWYRLEP